jgi:hypothetical protein
MVGEALEDGAAEPPLLGPTDPGVGLTDALGDAEGVVDPVGTVEDALEVDAVAPPGVDAVTLPLIGAAPAPIGAVAAMLGGGATTWAAVTAGADWPALAPPWPVVLPVAGADGVVNARPEVAFPRPLAELLPGERIASEPSSDWTAAFAATPLVAPWITVACEEETVPSTV